MTLNGRETEIRRAMLDGAQQVAVPALVGSGQLLSSRGLWVEGAPLRTKLCCRIRCVAMQRYLRAETK
jgi:hypothetical protein